MSSMWYPFSPMSPYEECGGPTPATHVYNSPDSVLGIMETNLRGLLARIVSLQDRYDEAVSRAESNAADRRETRARRREGYNHYDFHPLDDPQEPERDSIRILRLLYKSLKTEISKIEPEVYNCAHGPPGREALKLLNSLHEAIETLEKKYPEIPPMKLYPSEGYIYPGWYH